MNYFEWKREWVKDIINANYDWLYFPDTDKLVSYCIYTGLEVQMSSDYWQKFSVDCYMKTHLPLTTEQKTR